MANSKKIKRIPWNKGKRTGQLVWNKGKKGVQVAWNRGLKGYSNRGTFRKGHTLSEEVKKKISGSLKGRPTKNGGDHHYLWKGGITPINKKIRRSIEYKLWRESVFKRDNWTCVFCGIRGGKLHSDHIKRFADFPELRFAIDNGRTLCVECHKKTPTYGNKLR